MFPVLPQEVLELIVDAVHSANDPSTSRSLLVMLRAGRCFGPRCRTYIYRKIQLSLEEEPPLNRYITLSKRALRVLDLIRSNSSLGRLVKQVTYFLHFRPAGDNLIVMMESPAWQALTELKHYLVNVDHVSLNLSNPSGIFYTETVLDSVSLHLITIILPSSPFTALSITTVALQPRRLLQLLSHCPAVTALTLAEIESDSSFIFSPDTAVSSPPSMITELTLSDSEMFIEATQSFSIFKSLVSGVKRLVLLNLGLENLGFRSRIRDLVASMAYLDEVFVSSAFDDGLYLPELLHASSLCVEIEEVNNLYEIPTMLMDTTTAFRLERLALVIHTYRGSPFDSLWVDLAHIFRQPRLSTLTSVCITFNELHVADVLLDELRRRFSNSAKVTIRTMRLPEDDLQLSSMDMY